jgi:RNA polymerase primary sigma factor
VLFARLSPFEADILRRRVGLDASPEMTLKEMGQHHGPSRERIRQLQEHALCKLRDEFRQRGLMGYRLGSPVRRRRAGGG